MIRAKWRYLVDVHAHRFGGGDWESTPDEETAYLWFCLKDLLGIIVLGRGAMSVPADTFNK